ncbi:MAG TPA: hypothetical protein VGN14_02810 [Candidatus Elarobacter sp.]
MDVLLLGAYRFLGRAVIDAALDAGDRVTAFNRGNHPAPPGVESITGDRRDPSPLAGRRWDVVVDTSGQVPAQVAASAQLLAGAAGHYTFLSSLSVYREPLAPWFDETAPLAEMPPDVDPDDAEHVATYGPRKAKCEAAAEAAFPGRTLQVRAGFIVGPHDVSDRFLSWFDRLRRGMPAIVPGDAETPVQIVDVADLAAWILGGARRNLAGAFNATGPAQPYALIDVVRAAADAVGSRSRLVCVPSDVLLAAGVEPWTELPYWLDPPDRALMQAGVGKALASGLTLRRLRETCAAIAAWSATATHERRIALDPRKEADAIAAYERDAAAAPFASGARASCHDVTD